MNRKRIIALGMFDGVHMGHRALIARARQIAKESSCETVVFTFTNHPSETLGKEVKLLMPYRMRLNELAKLCDDVIAVPFTHEFADMPALDFVEMLLYEYSMAGVVMGFNYTFGRGGKGDANLMTSLAQKMGFTAEVVDKVTYEDSIVSSTYIRELIEKGDIERANKLLCGEFSLSGNIVPNMHIGGTLIGFPTANLIPDDGIVLPCEGVYATRVYIRGELYRGVTNIGSNPTVGGKKITVETHIIDFSGDIYGEAMTIDFVKRLRDCIKFDSIDGLRAQIADDVANAEKLAI